MSAIGTRVPSGPARSSSGLSRGDPRRRPADDVGQRADPGRGVNRTSFYGHFSSPEDLAIHAISELFDVVGEADIVLRAEHRVTGVQASRQALREIVRFIAERRASYVRLLGPGAARS